MKDKLQTKENQNDQFTISHQDAYSARQDPLNTIIRQRTGQNMKKPRSE